MSSTPCTHQGGESTELPQSKSSCPPNILIFGETGVGKSSIINMLSGKDTAGTSNDTMGKTFENVRYSIEISTQASIDDTNNTNSKEIIVWDTAGLNEAEHGNVSHDVAMKNIRNLVGKLEDGLSLLVYVVRGWRLSIVLKTNYDIFVTGLCKEQVPVVLVVTGCENDLSMDDWWTRNEKILDAHKLRFKGHACITSTRGKINDGEYVFEEEYKESEEKMRRLVVDNLLEKPWVADAKSLHETDAWFERTFSRTEPRVASRTAGPIYPGYRPEGQVHSTKRQRAKKDAGSRSKRTGLISRLGFFRASSDDTEDSEAITQELYR